jgi:hypothetical protein
MRSQAIDTSRCFGYAVARRRWRNSDAKDVEGSRICRRRSGGTTIRTPRCGTGRQKLDRSIQDHGAALDCRHLWENLSQRVETFGGDTIRLTRWRHHHQTHGLKRWTIHGGVIVNHSRHSTRGLTAVGLNFRLGVAFTHEYAEPSRSKNPAKENNQEYARRCGSRGHFSKLYLRHYEMRKLV